MPVKSRFDASDFWQTNTLSAESGNAKEKSDVVPPKVRGRARGAMYATRDLLHFFAARSARMPLCGGPYFQHTILASLPYAQPYSKPATSKTSQSIRSDSLANKDDRIVWSTRNTTGNPG